MEQFVAVPPKFAQACPASFTKIGPTPGSLTSSGPEPLMRRSPAKRLACGMNADAIADGRGILAKGLANWIEVGGVVLEGGRTDNRADEYLQKTCLIESP